MARYTKFNSNYIRRDTHQHLNGESTIFERDWLTIGGRFRYGPNKKILFGDGNFVFTGNRIPDTKKKHRLGSTVGEWTYDDVKDAKSDVNKIQIGNKINDIRKLAYYGSSVELIRTAVEDIVNTFPGIITAKSFKLKVPSYDGTGYVESNYAEIVNDFGYDLVSEPFVSSSYKILRGSYSDFLLNGYEITDYTVIARNMYEKTDVCYQNVKKAPSGGTATVRNIPSRPFICETKTLSQGTEYVDCNGETQRAEESGEYKVLSNQISILKEFSIDTKNHDGLNGINYTPVYLVVLVNGQELSFTGGNVVSTECHMGSETPFYALRRKSRVKVRYTPSSRVLTVYFYNASTGVLENTKEITIDSSYGVVRTIRAGFLVEESIKKEYTYLQMVDETDELGEKSRVSDWNNSNCLPGYWLRNSGFYKICDSEHYMTENGEDAWHYIRYSFLYWGNSQDSSVNHPINEITIRNANNETLKIYTYVVDGRIVNMTPYRETPFVISPKDTLMDSYFDNLDNLQKLLLNRDTKPLYTSIFLTPDNIESEDRVIYEPKSYTWPSYGNGCIAINSSPYFDYLNSLISMAENMDNLFSDNIWRRMTHEAIRNYDWTYTRQFSEGDEEDNITGGERMQKVIHIIGLVFDNIKLYIDSMKNVNRITYSGYSNLPEAMLSDKLIENGWDAYTTIPILEVPIFEEGTHESGSIDIGENGVNGRRNLRGDDDEPQQLEKYVDTDMGFVTIGSEEDIKPFVTNSSDKEYVWYPSLNVSHVNPLTVDNNFMRRFVLMSKRILATKGTVQSIDMVMGMFGYGEDDYKITEHYRTVRPVNYDELLDPLDEESMSFGDAVINLNENKNIEKDYDEDTSGIPVGSFISRDETYLIPYYNIEKFYDGDLYYQQNGGWYADLTKQKIYKYLRIDNDPENEDLISELKLFMQKLLYKQMFEFGTSITSITYNGYENNYWYYTFNINNSDEFTPVSDFRTNGENLFYKSLLYEDEEEKRVTCINDYGWKETLSYLHVVPDVKSLLSINPYEISFGDIYYVYNASDYFSYKTEEDDSELHSNFFAVINDYNPELLGSWKNIDLTDPSDEFYNKANYINDIISINTGNNPHVGYGLYDKGEGFFDYMRKPFKYAIDNNYFSFDEENFYKNANLVKFDISDDIEVDANPTEIDRFSTHPLMSTIGKYYYNTTDNKLYKCVNVTEDGYATWEEETDKSYETKTKIFHDEKDFTDVDTYIINDKTYEKKQFTGDSLTYNEHLYRTYNIDKIKDKQETTYYLNSKYIIIENKLQEQEGTVHNYFKEYFKEVIMKYIMQVIPSTTILVLKNFE